MANVLFFFPFAHTRILLSSLLLTRTGLPRRIQGAARGSLCATRIAWCAMGRGGEGEGEQGKEGKKEGEDYVNNYYKIFV